jgi:glutamate-1-semialdehyde aminotransferase
MPNSLSLEQDYPTIIESQKLWKRAEKLIPCGTQTLAKGPSQNTKGVAPIYIQQGKGARVWDVDGNEFIDLTMGVGPISLGYCYPDVNESIARQLQQGITFSLMSPLEVHAAEAIQQIVPNVESVRFSKTGCDVTTAAVRVARAYTKRDKILCCGYHGWHDWYIGTTSRAAGIPTSSKALTTAFPYNNIDAVKALADENTAAIILEPMIFEFPNETFLQELRDLCDSKGIVLIFDEMWTGFRFAKGGAQEAFGVRADLMCFSKAVANGMPISVLAGRADIMRVLEEDVFFFTTFGGEALSLAATVATLNVYQNHDVTGYLAIQGKKLKDGYNAIAAEMGLDYTSCTGHNSRSIVNFAPTSAGDSLLAKTLVQQEMIRYGVLWGGMHNMSFSHTDEEIAHVLRCYGLALKTLHTAVQSGNIRSFLRGEPLQPVFRKLAD